MKDRILIDWLSFTIHHLSVEDVVALIGLDGQVWTTGLRGLNGYRSRQEFLNISVCSDGTDEMGIFVNMSGQGCRTFEEYSTRSWDDLFKNLLVPCVNITRVDLAYDDFNQTLDLNQIVSDTRSCNFSTQFGTNEITDSWSNRDNQRAINIQWGRRGSNIMLRIYDKAIEQNRKKRFPEGMEHAAGSWNRCEIQFRNENAFALVEQYVKEKDIGEIYRGVLHYYLRYLDRSADSNVARCPLLPYWEKLLDQAGKIRLLQTEDRSYSIDRLINHTCNINGAAVSTAVEIMGAEEFMRLCNARPKAARYTELLKEAQLWKGDQSCG